MSTPLPGNTSGTARLLNDAPSFAVGWQEPVYVPNPAAGAEWSLAADGRYYTRLLSVRWTFAASAAVATRFTEFQIKDTNGVVVAEVPAGQGVVASTAVTPSLYPGCPIMCDAAQFQAPGNVPDLLIPPGWSWGTLTSAIQAGDQYSGIVMLVQRFPTDAAVISAVG